MMLTCEACATPFDWPQKQGVPPKYCGYPCKRVRATERGRLRRGLAAVTDWRCGHCGQPWIESGYPGKRTFCGKNCYTESKRTLAECVSCGKSFLRNRGPNQKFCFDPCVRKIDYSDAPSGRTHLRRCRERGIPFVYGITREGIAVRDGWDCRLCSRPIDGSLRWPHSLSASIDHIYPLSTSPQGHVWSNVQLAHLRCNVSKGNREVTSSASAQAC